MANDPSLNAIAVLSDASTSVAQQADACKKLKNFIIGQSGRKESAVNKGIVHPLAKILSTGVKATGKRKLDSVYPVAPNQSQTWSPDDELRLQATNMVASLAHGGPAFMQPLCAANIPDILVQALSTEPAPRLTLALMQALNTLATHYAATQQTANVSRFWTSVFNDATAKQFDSMLRLREPGPDAQQQVRLVTDLISLMPDHGSDADCIRSTLTNCGIIETLASLLVSSYTVTDPPDLLPCSPAQTMSSILAAIATIVTGSSYRATRFILAPAVRQLARPRDTSRIDFGAQDGIENPFVSLLPPLHIPRHRTYEQPVSGHFPALYSLESYKRSGSSMTSAQLHADISHSQAVCDWLLVLARSLQGLERLTALRLLALVVNATEVDTGARSRPVPLQKLALLAVPLSVLLVRDVDEDRLPDADMSQHDLRRFRVQPCATLALLIGSNRDLQVAAVEAGAIKHVCSLLKKSFDNVSLSKPMWSSSPSLHDSDALDTCKLGNHGLPSEILHSMDCRQSALEALAALAAEEDLHRQTVVKSGVVTSIIDALRPFSVIGLSEAAQSRNPPSPKDINTIPVVLAACRAAQSMSRSVSVLRTSLIDGGIVKPLIELLSHSSIQVQIAATDVCCNLLPEFSPMKKDLLEQNVIRTLGEHVRSASPALRLSSLWALKHLVYGCPTDIKLAALEELGTGWLVRIIQGDQRHPSTLPSGGSGTASIGLSSANAAGEKVDLLNPSSVYVDESGLTGDEMFDDENDIRDGESLSDEPTSMLYDSWPQHHPIKEEGNSRISGDQNLSLMRAIEQNEAYAAKRDEVSIQQQALDFIRNFMNGDDCVAMSDHIMEQIGSAKVYELLTAKLSPLPRSSSRGQVVYNPTELVLSTIHVIIHLANSASQRQMLIAQKPLLQAMLPHFNHHDHRVRLVSVWAVNSLTWIEEESDRSAAYRRGRDLQALGFERAVRELQNDPVLDVRERVKTAICLFNSAKE